MTTTSQILELLKAALRWKQLRGESRAIEVEAERALLAAIETWALNRPAESVPNTAELDVMALMKSLTPEARERILRWMLMLKSGS